MTLGLLVGKLESLIFRAKVIKHLNSQVRLEYRRGRHSKAKIRSLRIKRVRSTRNPLYLGLEKERTALKPIPMKYLLKQ